jgi:RND family efflux transporter MFP subunit
VIVAIACFFGFSSKKQEVSSDNKIQEVELINVNDYQNGNTVISAFGQIESMNQVDLKSQVSGNLESVNVKIGDQVNKGQLLAEIDHDVLDAQLEQARAAVDSLKSSLNLKVAGATQEQISLSQKQLDSAKVALEKAENNLTDVTKLTEESMRSKYNYASSSLDDATIKIYNSYTLVDTIKNNYFNNSDQQGLKVKSILENKLSDVKDGSKNITDNIDSDDHNKIDSSIDQIIAYLDTVLSSLTEVRDACDIYTYKNTVPDSVRSSIDSQKSVVSTIKNSIVSLKNDISVSKTQNQNSINSAKSAVDTAKSAVAIQEASLNSVTASPRDVDLEGINASIKQAEAAYRLAATNRDKAFIRAPFSGNVSAMPFKEGNLVTSGQVVASLVNKDGMQVRAYISEKEREYIEEGTSVSLGNGIDGIISNISPSINDSTKKIEVIIAITTEKSSLVIGDSIEAKIMAKKDLTESDKFLLPLKSVKFNSEQSMVYVLEENIVQEKKVKLGNVVNESVEVLEGLSMDDKIISSTRGLKAGDKVKVKE